MFDNCVVTICGSTWHHVWGAAPTHQPGPFELLGDGPQVLLEGHSSASLVWRVGGGDARVLGGSRWCSCRSRAGGTGVRSGQGQPGCQGPGWLRHGPLKRVPPGTSAAFVGLAALSSLPIAWVLVSGVFAQGLAPVLHLVPFVGRGLLELADGWCGGGRFSLSLSLYLVEGSSGARVPLIGVEGIRGLWALPLGRFDGWFLFHPRWFLLLWRILNCKLQILLIGAHLQFFVFQSVWLGFCSVFCQDYIRQSANTSGCDLTHCCSDSPLSEGLLREQKCLLVCFGSISPPLSFPVSQSHSATWCVQLPSEWFPPQLLTAFLLPGCQLPHQLVLCIRRKCSCSFF